VERFRDVIHHTHELVIRGGWVHALRYKVINSPRSIVQTEWKRCWGIPDKASQGERFSSGKLRHDIGE
jgi:hypothetical protein